jgi:uncharacterized repeat protein (TIGR03843 family)
VTAPPGWPQRPVVSDEVARELLTSGDAEVLGRMPWSSNATFLVNLASRAGEMLAVYKPERGERALWDFPRGSLARREVAAFELSDWLGWGIVPDTVLREGPAGPGMLQRFVDHDPDRHYFTLLEDHADEFRRMAAFDVVINNADRKGGHCIVDQRERVWGIDHGVSFHTHWKLRTVIWEFASEPLLPAICDDLHRLHGDLVRSRAVLRSRLTSLLHADEVDAVRGRVEGLLARGALPDADPGWHAYPWPLV